MYLKRVKLQNFGRITAGEYFFTEGMNLIRGANENGKSTLCEAALYAMFGTSALRGSLDDVFTEGTSVNDLKVEVDFGPYQVTRSKSSASVTGPGLRVSGQANVSSHFYDLLGIQKGTENQVLVSEQGKTAGILDGKASEVTSLIEDLAGFSQIDVLIDKVKLKYPSGNQSLLEELLAGVTSKIAEKDLEVPQDTKPLITENAGITDCMVDTESQWQSSQKILTQYKSDLAEVKAAVTLKESLADRLKVLQSQKSNDENRLAVAKEKSEEGLMVVYEETAYLEAYPTMQKAYDLYRSVADVKPWEGEIWDEDLESFEEELAYKTKELGHAGDLKKLIDREIQSQRALINSESTCSTCKQDISHLHAEINLRAQVEINRLEKALSDAEFSVADLTTELEALTNIQKEQQKRTKFEAYADKSQVPWIITWHQPVPEEPSLDRYRECQTEIKAATKHESEVNQAKERVVELEKNIANVETEIGSTTQQLNSIFPGNPADLEEKVTHFEAAAAELAKAYKEYENQLNTNKAEIQRIEAANEQLEKDKANLRAEEAALRERLKADAHNAEIMKELRKARPVILNRVWSNVLDSVSVAFSDMRGEDSQVVKTEKGFAVNSLPVHRLSGSAKSILGIAMRSTLRDIFAPAAGLMIFDEPASDADTDRTAAVVAALAAIRGQVLMITHESVSDSSAANIVEV